MYHLRFQFGRKKSLFKDLVNLQIEHEKYECVQSRTFKMFDIAATVMLMIGNFLEFSRRIVE